MFSFALMKKKEANLPKKAKPGPKGLGGWLILVCFGLILGILLGIIVLFGYFHLLIISRTTPVLNSILGIEMFFQIIYISAEIYLLYLFFKKNKNFPRFYIIFLWSLVAWVVLDYFMLSYISLTMPALKKIIDDLLLENPGEISRTFISSLIWILYAHKSKRVKATFVEG